MLVHHLPQTIRPASVQTNEVTAKFSHIPEIIASSFQLTKDVMTKDRDKIHFVQEIKCSISINSHKPS
jgi:hypothetical protein